MNTNNETLSGGLNPELNENTNIQTDERVSELLNELFEKSEREYDSDGNQTISFDFDTMLKLMFLTTPNEKLKELIDQTNVTMEPSKLISFDELKNISDSNYGKLNQSIDTDDLVSCFPELKTGKFPILKLMEHHYSFGEPVEVHYRCEVEVPNLGYTLFQDMTIEQWNSIGVE